jgi:hypothetical protein
MSAPPFPADGASVAEAVFVTGFPEAVIRALARGPLAFNRQGERLSLAALLGIATIAALGVRSLLDPERAIGLLI